MYLARETSGNEVRYFIRQSVRAENRWESRNLVGLGADPSRWIHYPGGNAFFIDERIEDALRTAQVSYTPEDLEDLFWPFLAPSVRRVLEPFRARSSRRTHRRYSTQELEALQKDLHPFDKRRLLFLRQGDSASGSAVKQPLRLYNRLLQKSRDEIEQMLEWMEAGLRPAERKPYVYWIFDLQRLFGTPLARRYPEAMDPERTDELFLEEVCRMQEDPVLFPGWDRARGLPPVLVRYVIQYFDNPWPIPDWSRDLVEEFIRLHRTFRARQVRIRAVPLEEALAVFCLSEEAFSRLSRRDLARLYRRIALDTHPDRGGSHEKFVRVAGAYRTLVLHKGEPGRRKQA